MPNLLSIPRELRDDIYRRLLNGPLVSKPSPRPRKRISKEQHPAKDAAIDSVSSATNSTHPASDEGAPTVAMNSSLAEGISGLTNKGPPEAEYYDGEEPVRYPLAKPLPPTHSLLHTCRQLRAEMLDTVCRNKLRYKIRLAFRDDTATIYPTWISVPALSNRIDVLDVEIRIRYGRTASLFSAAVGDDDELESEGDVLSGALVLLQRFLERGVYFLSKKKAQKTTIGLLELHIVPKDIRYRDTKDLFEETSEWVNEWLIGNRDDDVDEKERLRQDKFVRFFAERIDRVSCQVGEGRREWNMRDVIAERDRLKREKGEEEEREGILQFWNAVPGNCININTVLFVHAGFDIFQDAVTYVLPIQLLYSLQILTRQKTAPVLILALGAFVTITGVIRLRSLKNAMNPSDPIYDNADAVMWSSVVCASLLHFKPFLDRYCPGLIGWEFRLGGNGSEEHLRNLEVQDWVNGIYESMTITVWTKPRADSSLGTQVVKEVV